MTTTNPNHRGRGRQRAHGLQPPKVVPAPVIEREVVEREEIRGDEPEEAISIARPAPREESPRDRAARRAAELRANRDDNFDGSDQYYLDPDIIPDGFTYEWKTLFVLNQEQGQRILSYRKAGWEAVPRTRHPELMPLGSDEEFIVREGQILMELPTEIVEDFRRRDQRKAREQVTREEESVHNPDYLPEGFGKNKRDTRIKKSYEPMQIPD